MRITAAVLPETGEDIDVREVELAAPGPEEVLVRIHASGVCHSDLNAVDGTSATRRPAVLGHEGAGVIEAIGRGVQLKVGQHVALSWMPSCGRCEECVRGLTHLCRVAWTGMSHGGLLDGTPRLSWEKGPIYHYSYLSTFAQAAVVPERCVIPIPDNVSFDIAALVGCAVNTEAAVGFGSNAAVRTAVLSGYGVAALSREVVIDDLKQGKLKPVRLQDWQCRRRFYTIRRRDRKLTTAEEILLKFVRQED